MTTASVTGIWSSEFKEIPLAPFYANAPKPFGLAGAEEGHGSAAFVLRIVYEAVFGVLFVGFAIYMYRIIERLRLAGMSVQKAIAG